MGLKSNTVFNTLKMSENVSPSTPKCCCFHAFVNIVCSEKGGGHIFLTAIAQENKNSVRDLASTK